VYAPAKVHLLDESLKYEFRRALTTINNLINNLTIMKTQFNENSSHNRLIFLVKIYLGLILATLVVNSCKKEARTNYPLDLNIDNQRSIPEEAIPNFIDSVNAVYLRQSSTQEMTPSITKEYIEAALNYSFSDVDTALINDDTTSFSQTFSISLNANSNFNFLDIANTTKSLADYIKEINADETIRFQFCRIDALDENGNFAVMIVTGEMDPSFDYGTFPTPQQVVGNHLWRVDEYEFYNYIPCKEDDPYAPPVIEEGINTYLRKVASYRTKDIALAAPSGYTVYYDESEPVYVNSQFKFHWEDFVNLAKFDFPVGILSFEDRVCTIGDEPYRSAIYAADPSKVACWVLFHPTIYGHKSCINEIGMNYYISKSIDIFDILRPTALNNLFFSLKVKYIEQITSEDPILHEYRFWTKKAKIRPAGASIL